MKVPISWLKEFVDIDITPVELCDKLLGAGFEVEEIIRPCDGVRNIVIGKIIDIKPHFNADSLQVCTVDIGKEILSIVTGAKNVKKDDYVPVALVGAVVFGGKEIVPCDLRGVHSYGMLCGGSELGITDAVILGAEVDGILILQNGDIDASELVCGRNVLECLGLDDLVLDVSITSNRPDCQSIFGLAREVSAILNKSLRLPNTKTTKLEKDEISLKVSVNEPDLCPRYVAAVVNKVKVGVSPREIRRKLWLCGIRPINNIVDITNYVLLELGQPMHAFDKRYIKGDSLNIRKAKKGERLVCLNGNSYCLKEDNLIIADSDSPLAIAGVMGGELSGVKTDTEVIVLEAAKFQRGSVRFTARGLGLRSDSSARFEKGVDETAVAFAMERALNLITKQKCGKIASNLIDEYSKPLNQKTLSCTTTQINNILGIQIKPQAIAKILKGLQFDCVLKGEALTVGVPSFREDIEDFADLAEEVIRTHGYENIISTTISAATLTVGGESERSQKVNCLKGLMCEIGANEAMTFSFVGKKAFDSLCLSVDDPRRRAIPVQNPISEECAVMRTTLVHNMLSVLHTNLTRKNRDFALFELGKIYIADKLPLSELPCEKNILCYAVCGMNSDFYTVKGVACEVLERFGFVAKFCEDSSPYLHDGMRAGILADGERVGCFGKVHPTVAKNYGLNCDSYILEINIDYLLDNDSRAIKFVPLPRYPEVERDLAIVCGSDTPVGDLLDCIKKYGGEGLESCQLFDIYTGSQVASGCKSVAFRLVFRSPIRTLKDEEITQAMSQILTGMESDCGAKIRQ